MDVDGLIFSSVVIWCVAAVSGSIRWASVRRVLCLFVMKFMSEMLVHRGRLNQTGWWPSWLLCKHHCPYLCQQGAAWWALSWRSFCNVVVSISTCPASKLNISRSAKHVVSTFMKWLEMNDTRGSSWSRSQNLFSNSYSSLFMTSQSFSATLSNSWDAKGVAFSTDWTEGKCSTFFSVNPEKIFILALKTFKALIISTLVWYGLVSPVMSVKQCPLWVL